MRHFSVSQIIMFFTLGTLLSNAFATNIYYVNSRFKGSKQTGADWTQPFRSLQEAIDKAEASGGGEVWVRAGTYTPHSNKNRDCSFRLPSSVHLYGGFAGNETDRSRRNWRANRTIISGNRGYLNTVEDNCYHLILAEGAASLDGFFLTDGQADGIPPNTLPRNQANTFQTNHYVSGAAIYLTNATAFTVANCSFSSNNVAGNGGAVFSHSGNLSFSNCTFTANKASNSGGAIATTGTVHLVLNDCTFSKNHTTKVGGAVCMEGAGSIQTIHCDFKQNNADNIGGALALRGHEPDRLTATISDTTFYRNSALDPGGAILTEGSIETHIANVQFKANSSVRGAAVIYNIAGAQTLISSCQFERNRSAARAEDIVSDRASFHTSDPDRFNEQRSTFTPQADHAKAQREKMLNEGIPAPDAHLLNEKGEPITLMELLKQADWTLLTIACMSDPYFYSNAKSLEKLALGYAEKGLKSYHLNSFVLHPENHLLLNSFSLQEREKCIEKTKTELDLALPWLCDTMKNEAYQALGPNRLFLFSNDGTIRFAGSLADLNSLKQVLEKQLGKVVLPEIAEEPITLKPHTSKENEEGKVDPVNTLRSKLIKRMRIRMNEGYQPLVLEPQKSKHPFYAKLRAEATANLLRNGHGKLYISFLLDPLYPTKWNNLQGKITYKIISQPDFLVMPIEDELPRTSKKPTSTKDKIEQIEKEMRLKRRKVDKASASKTTGTDRKIYEKKYADAEDPLDAQPREFVLQVYRWESDAPLPLSVTYYVLLKETGANLKITQNYLIYKQVDPYAGQTFFRQAPLPEQKLRDQQDAEKDYIKLLRKNDISLNYQLEKIEAPEELFNNWSWLDQNADEHVTEEEYVTYSREFDQVNALMIDKIEQQLDTWLSPPPQEEEPQPSAQEPETHSKPQQPRKKTKKSSIRLHANPQRY